MFVIKSTYTNEIVKCHGDSDLLQQKVELYIKDCITHAQSAQNSELEYTFHESRTLPSGKVYSVYRIDVSGWWPMNYRTEKHLFDVWYEPDTLVSVDLLAKFEELKAYIISVSQKDRYSFNDLLDIKFNLSEFEQSGFFLDDNTQQAYQHITENTPLIENEEITLSFTPKQRHYCELPI